MSTSRSRSADRKGSQQASPVSGNKGSSQRASPAFANPMAWPHVGKGPGPTGFLNSSFSQDDDVTEEEIAAAAEALRPTPAAWPCNPAATTVCSAGADHDGEPASTQEVHSQLEHKRRKQKYAVANDLRPKLPQQHSEELLACALQAEGVNVDEIEFEECDPLQADDPWRRKGKGGVQSSSSSSQPQRFAMDTGDEASPAARASPSTLLAAGRPDSLEQAQVQAATAASRAATPSSPAPAPRPSTRLAPASGIHTHPACFGAEAHARPPASSSGLVCPRFEQNLDEVPTRNDVNQLLQDFANNSSAVVAESQQKPPESSTAALAPLVHGMPGAFSMTTATYSTERPLS